MRAQQAAVGDSIVLERWTDNRWVCGQRQAAWGGPRAAAREGSEHKQGGALWGERCRAWFTPVSPLWWLTPLTCAYFCAPRAPLAPPLPPHLSPPSVLPAPSFPPPPPPPPPGSVLPCAAPICVRLLPPPLGLPSSSLCLAPSCICHPGPPPPARIPSIPQERHPHPHRAKCCCWPGCRLHLGPPAPPLGPPEQGRQGPPQRQRRHRQRRGVAAAQVPLRQPPHP